MSLKMLGAILIIAGCGGFGFVLAANHRREEQGLHQLVGALDYMECELQYRLTPLPDLCRLAAGESQGAVKRVLAALSAELESQVSPDVASCMNAALGRGGDIPRRTRGCLQKLGATLGRFDLSGQIQGMEAVRRECRTELDKLARDRDVRIRSYQTLGLCAGAALAILFI